MNKKVSIVIIGVLVCITGLLLLLHSEEDSSPKDNNPTEKPTINYKYLVLDNISTWGYNEGMWRKVGVNSLEDKELIVFDNNRYLGLYHLKYGTSWNLFDDNNNYVNYEGNLLAFSTDFDIAVKNITEAELTGNDIINISNFVGFDINYDDLSTIAIKAIDLDENGYIDKIISVSNLDAETDQSSYFNLVYLDINGKNEVLLKESVATKDLLIAPNYDILSVINIENEDFSSIILQKGYFSEAGKTENMLFKYENGKYTKTFED